jgi:NADP-dependent 3-hydroxy acid dehydrogenase YdfG
MPLLSNQIVVITGASGGMGQAIVQTMLEHGAIVCLLGRDKKRLAEVAARSEKRGRCYAADLTAEGQLHAAVEKILAENQRIDGLIHCAGIVRTGSVASASTEDFDRQFKTNVLAPFRLTQLLLPSLIKARGQVLFINSRAGLTAGPNVSQYAATKHALRAVADSLRSECNAAGVRVSSLFFGDTATPMQADLRRQQSRPYDPKRIIQPADVSAIVLALLALPRTAEITDVMIRPMTKT